MNRENDEITNLFRSRLGDAEMTVRDGFWNELSSSVNAAQRHRKLILTRLTAVASVLLVLGVSSAAFWFFSPKDEIGQAFTQIATTSGTGTLNGDAVRQNFTPIQAHPILQKPVAKHSGASVWNNEQEDEDSVSISFSMTFTYSEKSFSGDRNALRSTNGNGTGNWRVGGSGDQRTVSDEQKETKDVTAVESSEKPRRRAVKVAVGTALPADNGKFKMPFSVSTTLEQPLGKKFSVEAGIQYSNLRSDGQNLHYIGVPIKMNYTLASTRKLDWYASIGGLVDKCIAGAPDNSGEPIQLALMAGIGVNYKINERIALFAEPGVSHHFHTSSALETIRTVRPTNLNLICGIRMTY